MVCACSPTDAGPAVAGTARPVEAIAARDGRSVGSVIRAAVDSFVEAEPNRRQRALKRLFAMNAPVDDSEVMKAQILKSRLGDW